MGQGTAWRKAAIPGDRSPEGGPNVARGTLVLGLLAIALAYIDTLRFQFVYDDLPQIVNNPLVHSWQYAPRYFIEHVWSQIPGLPGTYYRPVFLLWLRLNHACFGLSPFAWHLTTLLVHLAVTVLVYRLLFRVIADRLTAAFAAVLFGLHPVHIEAVAWISGVSEPLNAILFLGALLAYVRARERRSPLWLAASLVLYIVAMLSKETALVLPAFVLLYEWLYHPGQAAGPPPLGQRLRRAVLFLSPYVLLSLLYVALRIHVLAGFSLRDLSHTL